VVFRIEGLSDGPRATKIVKSRAAGVRSLAAECASGAYPSTIKIGEPLAAADLYICAPARDTTPPLTKEGPSSPLTASDPQL
jgi:hypothetical protein